MRHLFLTVLLIASISFNIVGLMIVSNLLKEFVSQTKGRRYATGEQKPIIDPNDPKFDKVKKLMSEGF